MHQPESDNSQPPPQPMTVSISIGTDGTVILDELPAELLAVIRELCPADELLMQRQAAAEAFEKGTTWQ